MTNHEDFINGNGRLDFPVNHAEMFSAQGLSLLRRGICCMVQYDAYLKKHTEALVKDVGIEKACELTGRSKATLGRYYSDSDEHADRFMPVDAVAALEAESSYPHVTSALAEMRGITMSYNDAKRNEAGGINSDVIMLSQRFAMLMGEYNQSIEDGVISANEAKRLLRETLALQKVLMEMKLHLEHDQG